MRRPVACALATVLFLAWASPATAAPASPRPTATLLSTGTLTTELGEEVYLEVSAQDPDGIITEIEIYWGDGSISFAHSYPCLIPPLPEAGDAHRFLVSNPYQEPGRYNVRYVVHSTSGCDGEALDQHSRPYSVRVAAP